MKTTIAQVRIAGDSGDGIQVVGQQLASTVAQAGNDLRSLPDFPAEIRAPTGTIGGVSSYQICFASDKIYTVQDEVDVLVAFNPAALKLHLADLKPNGILIIDKDKFVEKEYNKANTGSEFLDKIKLQQYQIIEIPISMLVKTALSDSTLSFSKIKKCKNMFALGVVYWLFHESLANTIAWLEAKFAKDLLVKTANQKALQAGYNYAMTAELFNNIYEVPRAELLKGRYRYINGNQALVYGALSAALLAKKNLFAAGYPITPATDILQGLAQFKYNNIKTLQAEDEIAAATAAIGAAFAGSLALTVTSGPGFDLKSEALGLAVMAELPLVVIDVQRAGPSTGMPTKVEQADLLSALYGRHGEAPVVVLAPCSATDCFNIIILAFKIAIKYMVPVIILSDTVIANSIEPWLLRDLNELQRENNLASEIRAVPSDFQPYLRDDATLARYWAYPSMPNFEHCIGGLEKQDVTGSVNYDPLNHEHMVNLRQMKVNKVRDILPPAEIIGESTGDLLVITWGSNYGPCLTAVQELQVSGFKITLLILRILNPLENIGNILAKFNKILVPELNHGQLAMVLRAKFLYDIKSYTKIQGKPFKIHELKQAMLEVLK